MSMVLVDKDKLIDFILNSKPSERQAPSQIMQALNPIPADGLIEALTLAINRFETIADGIDNGDCDSIAPTLLRRAANTADKALKGEK